ncbi:SDR family NAD(P)-dependent oxidoreductase [Promineifilum sp.]|uniref:SDR family NAD(P)-dependent oxidoreductase n=1 Tax=Promineifilum sp. TaxID=2664178 RepID=UPI0035AF1BD4
MKAFVTGGTGFIGRSVVRQLLARGYRVAALTRSERGAAALREMGAQVVPGDVTDRESMRAAMRDADVVFHIAAIYDYSPAAKAQSEAINVEGTRNVLELAHELGVPKIVYTSTLAVFGDTKGELPDETYYTEGPFLTEYDRTKWKAHYEVAEPLIEQGAPIIIVMPGVAYGPGDTSWLAETMRLFHRGLLPIVPGPESVATYAYVDDIAEGHILAAEKGRVGECYILAGPAVPLGEMVEFWSQLTGRRAPLFGLPARFLRPMAPAGRVQPALSLPTVFGPDMIGSLGVSYAGRSDKARAELGWRPRPLQAGMLETFEWIAATEPADAGAREKRAAGLILLAALVLVILLLRRRVERVS